MFLFNRNKKGEKRVQEVRAQEYEPEATQKFFMTFQPKKVAKELAQNDYVVKSGNYNEIRQEFGYNPIFIIPINSKKETIFWLFLCSPSKAESLIILKKDNYDRIDAAKWYEVKGKEKRHETLKPQHENDICEYITSEINKKDVVDIIDIKSMLDLNNNLMYKMLKVQGLFEEKIRMILLMYNIDFWNILGRNTNVSDDTDISRFLNEDINIITSQMQKYSFVGTQKERLEKTWKLFFPEE